MSNQSFVCKTCGAPLDAFVAQSTDGLVTCKYCQNVWTIPRKSTTPVALEFLRIGEHNLDIGRFDDAIEAYKKAVEHDPDEPEAYFGIALAKFKVRHLKDHVNNRLQPICYEVTEKKFTEDDAYLHALEIATPEQREEYKRKGEEIDYILGEFSKLKQSGLTYDCFICVKVTDDAAKQLTEDSKDADYIYKLLQDKGYKPFYSERELRHVTGADYEARILYALYTSECMLVVCYDESYLQTPWVKNEYSRFLKLVNDEEKESDSISIVFNEVPIEKLPGRKGKLQGIDFAKRSADGQILDFVKNHTPEARARRDAEAAAKSKAEEEQKRAIAEQRRALEEQRKAIEEQQRQISEQLEKLKATPVTGAVSEDELLDRIELARAERERKKREEEERKRQEEECIAQEFFVTDKQLQIYNGKRENVEIPYGITSVGRGAFSGRTNLTSIDIPSSVTSIGECSFDNCANLKSITIPNSVTSIGRCAFRDCTSLTSITIPNSVTSIGESAFAGCTNLKSMTIPDSVTKIDSDAFKGCTSLTSITIPNSVTSIGRCAFRDCTSLTSITIPNSVTFIGYNAFSDCTSLTSITIPENVTQIGEDTFNGCTSLATVHWNAINCKINKNGRLTCIFIFNGETLKTVNIGNNVKSIPDSAFFACKGLENVTIPDSVTSIGYGAFAGCPNLTSITIPDSVTEIGSEAFRGCSSLTSITIPENVTSIGDKAFANCMSLETIYWNAANCILRGYNSSMVFEDCGLLKTVNIGDNVKCIPLNIFKGCTNLTSITIPDSVTEIYGDAFCGCKNLTSVNFGNDSNLETIGGDAFKGCTNLTSITIPDSVTEISSNAFQGCTSLTSITIPESVTEIGRSAFMDCNNNLTIYCRANKKSKLFAEDWDLLKPGNLFSRKRAKVVWGYKGK